MRLRQIYISPDHRYFGHHGKPPGDAPMVRVQEAICRAGLGLEGDRFFDYKPDYKGQVTFFSLGVYEELCQAFDVKDREPWVFRRNLLVSDVELPGLIGQEFEVQGVRFAGTEEASPCYWMDQAFAPGALEALKGKGGLRARILSDGILREEE